MPPDRKGGRNIHLYHADDRDKPLKEPLGGLVLTAGITKSNFYSMTDVLFDGDYRLHDEEGSELASNPDPMLPGNYYVSGRFNVTTESYACRPYSSSSSTSARTQAFTNGVRNRDGRCVITDRPARMASSTNWVGFQAAHIYPLSLCSSWDTHQFGIAGINSVQNGLLLDASVHQHLGAFHFSIDINDSYKVILFDNGAHDLLRFRHLSQQSYEHPGQPPTEWLGIKYLSQQLLDHPERPPDVLLEWHFRQTVLINIKGVGEPVFEHDFPPGSDMLGQIRDGPKVAERMGMQLFSRLAHCL